jgi:hypothetical protein
MGDVCCVQSFSLKIYLQKVMAIVVVSKWVTFGALRRGRHGAAGYETLDAIHLPLVLLVEIFLR